MASADGTVSSIGNGLRLAAQPGGPGIVVRAATETAVALRDMLPPGAGGTAAVDRLLGAFREQGLEMALAVADGTGPGQEGFALAFEHGKATVRYPHRPATSPEL